MQEQPSRQESNADAALRKNVLHFIAIFLPNDQSYAVSL